MYAWVIIVSQIYPQLFFLNYSAADRHVSSTEFNYFSKSAKTLYFGAMALFLCWETLGRIVVKIYLLFLNKHYHHQTFFWEIALWDGHWPELLFYRTYMYMYMYVPNSDILRPERAWFAPSDDFDIPYPYSSISSSAWEYTAGGWFLWCICACTVGGGVNADLFAMSNDGSGIPGNTGKFWYTCGNREAAVAINAGKLKLK